MASHVVQVLLAAFILEGKKKKRMLACRTWHALFKTKQNKNPNCGCLQLFSITVLSACNCSMFSIMECQVNEYVRV